MICYSRIQCGGKISTTLIQHLNFNPTAPVELLTDQQVRLVELGSFRCECDHSVSFFIKLIFAQEPKIELTDYSDDRITFVSQFVSFCCSFVLI